MELSRLRDAKSVQYLHGAQALNGTPRNAGANRLGLEEGHVERGIVRHDNPPGQSGEKVADKISEAGCSGEIPGPNAVNAAAGRPRLGVDEGRPFVDRLRVLAQADNGQ